MARWPVEWLPSTPGRRCPRCGEPAGRPLVFGMPSYDLVLAEGRGEVDVVLAGCTISFETRHCRACGHAWADAVDLGPDDEASTGPEPGASA